MDWKEMLGAMRHDMPPGDDNDTAGTQETEKAAPLPTLHVERSVKGRAGRRAVIISGFDVDDDAALRPVLKQLQSALGTGGSARGGEILIQGDCLDAVADRLRAMGYRVK